MDGLSLPGIGSASPLRTFGPGTGFLRGRGGIPAV